MVNNRKIRNDIQTMDMGNVDSILSRKYKVAAKKLQGYSEDIKRELLYDLERDFQYFQEQLQASNSGL